MRAEYIKYTLNFKRPAITSRNTLLTKDTYYVKVWDEENPTLCGLGEASLFRGLSAEDFPCYENKLREVCHNINSIDFDSLKSWSSILFGLETAITDLNGGGRRMLYDTPFTRGEEGIRINGLIWMGNKDEMAERISEKLSQGFKCLKLKIGGIEFSSELELIKSIRNRFPKDVLELRLDANGAFSPIDALQKLEQLSPYEIHSIEQPIKQGNYQAMADICNSSPIPIALDEELIGVVEREAKVEMLNVIKPQYIILKPSLAGGFASSDEWIYLAEERGIGWWATSALESNIGLNAISQWVSAKPITMPQGLGTGQLYTNNISSPLFIDGERLYHNPSQKWDLSLI
ncbi:MAG: o-succinylbenzoate synthase [Bacteroidales bacterium]|nr:o-succinylbenzoate synthase [Bacteroidales bacterium]